MTTPNDLPSVGTEDARAAFEHRMLDFGWRNFTGEVMGTPPCWYYANSDLNARWVGWREAIAALAVQPGAVGEWKRVPVAPTRDMINAGQCGCMDNDVTVCVWKAMLAAAPTEAKPAQDAVDAERYRWLRSNWFTMGAWYPDGKVKFTTGETKWSDQPESNIDDAIDAAISAKKG